MFPNNKIQSNLNIITFFVALRKSLQRSGRTMHLIQKNTLRIQNLKELELESMTKTRQRRIRVQNFKYFSQLSETRENNQISLLSCHVLFCYVNFFSVLHQHFIIFMLVLRRNQMKNQQNVNFRRLKLKFDKLKDQTR